MDNGIIAKVKALTWEEIMKAMNNLIIVRFVYLSKLHHRLEFLTKDALYELYPAGRSMSKCVRMRLNGTYERSPNFYLDNDLYNKILSIAEDHREETIHEISLGVIDYK